MQRFFLLLIFITFSFTKCLAQENVLKDYHTTLNYKYVYKVDIDINHWEYQNNHKSTVIFDLNNEGKGRVILYYQSKHIFYVTKNYRVTYSDNSATYFFELENGGLLRLGVTANNFTSAFSVVLENNISLTFTN